MTSPTIKERLVLTVHRLVFAIYCFAIYYESRYVYPPEDSEFAKQRRGFGGRLKYLTFLNILLLQTTFFGLALMCDMMGSRGKKPGKLHRFRDWFFTTLVTPTGAFVSLSFWGIYAVDRELIFPKAIDAWYPWWLNHTYHTLPGVIVLAEILFVEHKYQKSFAFKWMPMLTLVTAYNSWLFYVNYAGGFWIYPIFAVLSPEKRTGFVVFLTLIFCFLMILGEKISGLIYGKKTQKKRSKSPSPPKDSKPSPKKSKKGKSSR